MSTGGGLARVAYAALLEAARELRDTGTSTYIDAALPDIDLEPALAACGRPTD